MLTNVASTIAGVITLIKFIIVQGSQDWYDMAVVREGCCPECGKALPRGQVRAWGRRDEREDASG